jgi:hypothetical protein
LIGIHFNSEPPGVCNWVRGNVAFRIGSRWNVQRCETKFRRVRKCSALWTLSSDSLNKRLQHCSTKTRTSLFQVQFRWSSVCILFGIPQVRNLYSPGPPSPRQIGCYHHLCPGVLPQRRTEGQSWQLPRTSIPICGHNLPHPWMFLTKGIHCVAESKEAQHPPTCIFKEKSSLSLGDKHPH